MTAVYMIIFTIITTTIHSIMDGHGMPAGVTAGAGATLGDLGTAGTDRSGDGVIRDHGSLGA